ncbi:DUF2141 domain-containing protein [Calothrix sp. NIES-3974]|uniref:DUF2141 domain-containing protein n=1 Tax=Calothrix sp. NIES-3974 TaxID=2005462 RepID=UPI000B5FF063|nr:DUF2141 domain-containing protein [Calothrix sp. NIES-3974]BAZ06834.1 hypothetical protein NIES3974_34960 [Calothrix sp. NIES-3974]
MQERSSLPSSNCIDTTSTLTVEIDNLRNYLGKVYVSLFADGKGFPHNAKNAVQVKIVEITDIPLIIKFDRLQPGDYAIALIHDENGDGKLNCNILGIPTEGFGFSQNPPLRIGSPKFQETMFPVSGANTTIRIKVIYLLGG